MYLLSIVIVNWNVAELLINAIRSILDNPPSGEFEIIVVDNASTDDSLERLKKNFPMVKIIANMENRGFGRANNQGIEIAEGEYIFLLNPDTIVIQDALDRLINALQTHPEVGMVGPALFKNFEMEPQMGGARLSRKLFSGILLDLIYINRIPWIGPALVKALRYPYDLNKEAYVEVISGSAMLFKASTISQVGGFDERFFLSGEDIELCDRFWQKSYKILYDPSAKIIHFNQSCSPQDPVNTFVNKFLGVAKYYQLKDGRWAHLCFRIATYIILTPKLLIKALVAFLRRDNEASRFNLQVLNKLLHWRLSGEAVEFHDE